MSNIYDRIRHATLPALDRFLKFIHPNLYAESNTLRREFVCTVNFSEQELIFKLRKIGFHENPLSALKSYDGVREIGSYVYRSSIFSHYQLHVILFELDTDLDTTAIFAHYEYSWLRHPIKHYRADYVDREEGVRRMKNIIRKYNLHV